MPHAITKSDEDWNAAGSSACLSRLLLVVPLDPTWRGPGVGDGPGPFDSPVFGIVSDTKKL